MSDTINIAFSKCFLNHRPNAKVLGVVLYDMQNLRRDMNYVFEKCVASSYASVLSGERLRLEFYDPCNNGNTIGTILADRLYKSSRFYAKRTKAVMRLRRNNLDLDRASKNRRARIERS